MILFRVIAMLVVYQVGLCLTIPSDYMFMIYKSGCMCFHTEAAVYLTIMISGYLIVHVISRLWFGMCMMIIS